MEDTGTVHGLTSLRGAGVTRCIAPHARFGVYFSQILMADKIPPPLASTSLALQTRSSQPHLPGSPASIRDLPPFSHLWIGRHALHIASPVISNILEACKQETQLIIVKDAICQGSIVDFRSSANIHRGPQVSIWPR